MESNQYSFTGTKFSWAIRSHFFFFLTEKGISYALFDSSVNSVPSLGQCFVATESNHKQLLSTLSL